MKHGMDLLRIFTIPFVVLALLGAARAAEPDSAAVEQLHNDLRKLKTEVEAAMNKGDIDGVLKHAHKDVVLTSLNGGGGRGHAKVREYNDKLMKGQARTVESVSITFTPDELSLIYGGDTAISWGSSVGKYKLVGGAEYEINSRWTSTLVREEGRWQIASFHISANLFDNPVLSALTKTLYWAAGIAALVALILGFLIGRRGKR
jgi:ketosteroid isomerase-like protein